MVTQKKPNTELHDALFAARYVFLAVAMFSFILNLLTLVSPFYMLQIYDRVLSSQSKDTLFVLTMLGASLLAISAMLDLIRARVMVRLSARLDRHMTHDVFAALIEDRVASRSGAGSQPLRDLENLRGFVTGPGLTAFFDAPWMPIFLGIIFLFHPWLGAMALSGAAVLLTLAILSEVTTRQSLRDASAASIQANRFAENSIRNAEAVWAMGMVGDLRRRWQERYFRAIGHSGVAADSFATISAMAKFVRPLLQMGVLGVGAYLVIEQQISAGVMIATSIIMGRALAPVEASITHWRSFVGARTAYGRLSALLAAYEIKGEKMSLPTPRGEISVEGATLVPPGAVKPTLVSIGFRLQPGEILGVVGASAAGKSCLARLLTGIWSPKVGAVRLDGADIADWDRGQLGAHLGYLPQDVELFDGTVAENIARFQDLCPDAVSQAAQFANAHEMILRLPEAYETQIGDGGCILSGGQRQRIGLARAIYKLPCFIVLDEPNANLDSEGEAALLETLRGLKRLSRTVVIISHKRNALSEADKLLILEAGKVKAFGDRDEVLKMLWVPRVVATQQPPVEGAQR